MATRTLVPTGATPARLRRTNPLTRLAVPALLRDPRPRITLRRRTSISRRITPSHTTRLPRAVPLHTDTILLPTANRLRPTGSHRRDPMVPRTRNSRATELRRLPEDIIRRSMRLLLGLRLVDTGAMEFLAVRAVLIRGITRHNRRMVASRLTASNNRMAMARLTEVPSCPC
jgi:hypothetical protein